MNKQMLSQLQKQEAQVVDKSNQNEHQLHLEQLLHRWLNVNIKHRDYDLVHRNRRFLDEELLEMLSNVFVSSQLHLNKQITNPKQQKY